MTIPLNRVVAFAGPYLSLLAGGVAAWLIAKANVLGIPGLGTHHDELATGIAAGLTLLLTSGLSHLGQMKWLQGVHVDMLATAQTQAALLAAPSVPPQLPPGINDAVDAGRAVEVSVSGPEPGEDDLPDDETEFGSPPPAGPPVVQASQSGVIEP